MIRVRESLVACNVLLGFLLPELGNESNAPNGRGDVVRAQAEPHVFQLVCFVEMDLERPVKDVSQQDHCERSEPENRSRQEVHCLSATLGAKPEILVRQVDQRIRNLWESQTDAKEGRCHDSDRAEIDNQEMRLVSPSIGLPLRSKMLRHLLGQKWVVEERMPDAGNAKEHENRYCEVSAVHFSFYSVEYALSQESHAYRRQNPQEVPIIGSNCRAFPSLNGERQFGISVALRTGLRMA